MKKKTPRQAPVARRDIENLLHKQTAVILDAVDGRLEKFEERFDAVDHRIEKLDERFNRKLDQLMTTLDHFLKRLTDSELEFTIMKKDVNQIKTILKERLGVDLF